MKTCKTVLFPVFLFFIIIPVQAEVLSLPPVTCESAFDKIGWFPSFCGWLDFRHHVPSDDEIAPAWIQDTGLVFTIYSWKNIAIEGMSRHIFLHRLNPYNYLLFWPLALFTDLRLSAVFSIFDVNASVSFRHDCKHDIETNFGRIAIHESLQAGLDFPSHTIRWQQMNFTTLLDGSIQLRFHFRPLFQNVNVAEPDIFCLTLCGEIDPVVLPDVFSLFIQAELNMLVRDIYSDVVIPEPFVLDWSIKTGIRLFKRQKGLSIYTELESLSDDWITVTQVSQILFSFGLLISM